jgi:hypothetical protein
MYRDVTHKILYEPNSRATILNNTFVQVHFQLHQVYISVSDVTYEENEATRTVACLPVGNPSIYTYDSLLHQYTVTAVLRGHLWYKEKVAL